MARSATHWVCVCTSLHTARSRRNSKCGTCYLRPRFLPAQSVRMEADTEENLQDAAFFFNTVERGRRQKEDLDWKCRNLWWTRGGGGDGRNYFKPKESDTTLSVNPPKSVAERWKQRKIWVSGDVFQRCLEHRGWTPIISWTNKCTPLLLFPLRALLEVSGGKENCINKFWKQVQSSRCVGVKCGGIPDFWKLFFRLFCWTNAFNR